MRRRRSKSWNSFSKKEFQKVIKTVASQPAGQPASYSGTVGRVVESDIEHPQFKFGANTIEEI